jgi:hypothetical protein
MTSTDHNIIKPDRSKARTTAWLSAGGLVAVCAAATAAAATGTGLALAQHYGATEAGFDKTMGVIAGMTATLAIGVIWKSRFRADGDGPVSKRIDEFQTRQRQVLLAITIMVAAFGAAAIGHALHADGPIEFDFSIEFALLGVAVAAAATFGVGFAVRRYRIAANDELVRELRGRVAQIGYMLTIVGLSGTYILYQFRPDLLAVAMPIALFFAIIAPAFYFLVAEGRASRDG